VFCCQVEATTRQKLRNPNIFVSPTRLCVRNIPVSVSDSRLKKIFLEAAGNRHARVTEVCSWSRYGAEVHSVIASWNFMKRKFWLACWSVVFVCMFVICLCSTRLQFKSRLQQTSHYTWWSLPSGRRMSSGLTLYFLWVLEWPTTLHLQLFQQLINTTLCLAFLRKFVCQPLSCVPLQILTFIKILSLDLVAEYHVDCRHTLQ